MPWFVITREMDEIEGRSSAMSSEISALVFAKDLNRAGVGVLRVEGPNGETMGPDEIAEWWRLRRADRPSASGSAR